LAFLDFDVCLNIAITFDWPEEEANRASRHDE
jgi:hypothetical protein